MLFADVHHAFILQKTLEIESITIHKNYNIDLNNFDVALLNLEKCIDNFTDNIRPACLPKNDQVMDKVDSVIIAGWGKLGPTKGPSDVLQKTELSHLRDCKRYTKFKTDVCAIQNGTKSCSGDSGGESNSLQMPDFI